MTWNEVLNETILPQVMLILQTIIYIGVPILTGFIVKWIDNFFSLLNNKTTDEKIQRRLKNASDAVEQIVHYVSQTYVDSLKKDGVFDVTEQQIALSKTKKLALKMINEESQKLIENMYGDFSQWLDTKIESVIANK